MLSFPLRAKLFSTLGRALCIILFAWTLSFACAMPMAFVVTINRIPLPEWADVHIKQLVRNLSARSTSKSFPSSFNFFFSAYFRLAIGNALTRREIQNQLDKTLTDFCVVGVVWDTGQAISCFWVPIDNLISGILWYFDSWFPLINLFLGIF